MTKRLLTLGVSLAMLVTVCVPGALITKADTPLVCTIEEHTHTEACYQDNELVCGLEEHTHGEGCYAVESVDPENPNPENPNPENPDQGNPQPENPNPENPNPKNPNPENPQPEGKECTCEPKPAEGEPHQEGCPLYQAPEQPEGKECTCEPKPAEGEPHQKDCPLYVEPACTCEPKPAEGELHQKDCPLYQAHIEGCSEGCTVEGCKCPCHNKNDLFERLMACQTLEKLYALAQATPKEELEALTEEQNAQIEAKITALEPAPLPPIGENEATVVAVEAETADSEIIYPIVDFDNVAPFGAPVEG